MADNPRIEGLRRRVQQDPASIAFAQLAEEYRRTGRFDEAVDVCRTGLAVHAGFLSAHVTLGRALLELGQLDEAEAELERVLKSVPTNLAAIRGVAEIHFRRGWLPSSLARYRAALVLAQNDPDLQQVVADLSRKLASNDVPTADAVSSAQPPLEPIDDPSQRAVAALEQWIAAIHVIRAARHA